METAVAKCASKACTETIVGTRANVRMRASVKRRPDRASAHQGSSGPRAIPRARPASTARTASWSAIADRGVVATPLRASAHRKWAAQWGRPDPTACQTASKGRGVKIAKTSVHVRTTGFATQKPEAVPAGSGGPDHFVNENALTVHGDRTANSSVHATRTKFVTG